MTALKTQQSYTQIHHSNLEPSKEDQKNSKLRQTYFHHIFVTQGVVQVYLRDLQPDLVNDTAPLFLRPFHSREGTHHRNIH